MRKLNQFMKFDWEAFAKGKRFLCVGGGKWVDYNTKEHRGTKIDVVITTDNTQYHQNEGEVVSNRFEKLSIKVSNDIEIPVNQHVIPTGVVAKVYGDYRNQLSITADGITVIPAKG